MFDAKLIKSVRVKMRKAAKEDTVEGHLVAQVDSWGGVAAKLMFLPGWPDRLVLLPGGIIAFVETKRPHGGRDEPRQPRVQAMLRRLGFRVYKVKTKDEVDTILQEILNA